MATLREVANLAQVSIATASRVLNSTGSSSRYSDDCAQRVRQAAEELGYTRNYHAGSLRAGRANFLGFAYEFLPLSPECRPEDDLMAGNEYWGRIISGLSHGARLADYQLSIIGPTRGEGALELAFRYLRERRIDGLVVPAEVRRELWAPLLAGSASPVVLVGHAEATVVPVVDYDSGAAIAQAVEHLASLGHRRVLWYGPVAPPGHTPTSDIRAEQFAAAAFRAGISGGVERYVLDPPFPPPREIVSQAARQFAPLLTPDRAFTAVICYNDHTALGLYRAAHAAGLRIPQDLSVIGFDDFLAEYATPPMTTIAHCCGEMGVRAADLLLEMIGDSARREALRGSRSVVAPELIVRESTARPPRETPTR